MKKIIRIIILAILAITFSFNTVLADDTVYTEGAFNYVLNDDGSIKIINYFGNDAKVEIPRAIGLYEINGQYVPRYVTIIAATTFENFKPTTIIIPDTVVYIEEGAIGSGMNVQYSDESGKVIKEEDADPIIIKPTENPMNKQNEDSNGEEFEEIGNEIDSKTGEEKDIFEITENEQNEKDDEVFERKGDSSTDFDEITISPFGYVLFAAIICIIVYSSIKKKNNNIKEVKNAEIKKPVAEEKKPQKKRKTTNKKSSTPKKKSATKTKIKRNSSKK